jgi:peptidoglycan/xylan/chitin deacetylase (PgdA/CDA1 family)
MKILCYHGIINKKKKSTSNFALKHIEKKTFIKQIKYLKKNTNIISMDEVCYNISNKIKFKKNSVCITFDDGFENNFKIACPILKKYKIPTLFYLCPEIISKKYFFWVDIIEICLLNTKQKLINVGKNNKYILNNIKNRKTAVTKIKKYCKSIDDSKKNKIIKSIMAQSKVNYKSYINQDIYKPASWSQIKKVLNSNLFQIGGHSLLHSLLTKKSKTQMTKDIKETIKIIKKKTNVRVKYFSYPEGRFNKSIINVMKNNKIVSSPIATSGTNSVNTNLFKLKRYMVGFSGTKFPFSIS